MAGIYAVYSNNLPLPVENYKHFFTTRFKDTIQEEHRHQDFIYGRSTINKFLSDRFLFEDEEIIIGVEGVLYNIKNPVSYFKDRFKEEGIDFISNLEGQFSGFVFEKEKNKIFIFTDQVSSKPIYYYLNKDSQVFAFTSECKLIPSIAKDLGFSLTINERAFKSLLSFGYLLEDDTPVSEVKKLLYGSILEVDLGSMEMNITSYFTLAKTPSRHTKTETIEYIDTLLTKAVANEWNKDKEYGLSHYAHLSGGLDSRVNVMLAHELGFQNIRTLTFSERNTSDEHIAKQISEYLETNHTFLPLSGDFLLQSIQDYILAEDGMTVFYRAAHSYNSTRLLPFLRDVGGAHTGQIGDVLFGSFSNKPTITTANVGKLGVNRDLDILSSIEGLSELIERYNFEGGAEVFSFEQRQFNGTFSGDRIVSHMIDNFSPFYDKALLQYCINIPIQFKKNQGIYLDWFNAKHPDIAKFRWQKTGMKPKKSSLKFKTGSYTRKVIKELYKLSGRAFDNMNPFDSWFANSDELRSRYAQLFNKNIGILESKELQKLARTVFNKGDATSMMIAVSALFTIKLYLNQLED